MTKWVRMRPFTAPKAQEPSYCTEMSKPVACATHDSAHHVTSTRTSKQPQPQPLRATQQLGPPSAPPPTYSLSVLGSHRLRRITGDIDRIYPRAAIAPFGSNSTGRHAAAPASCPAQPPSRARRRQCVIAANFAYLHAGSSCQEKLGTALYVP